MEYAWIGYHTFKQHGAIFLLKECVCPSAAILVYNYHFGNFQCAYHGVVVGRMKDSFTSDFSSMGVFFLENQWMLETDIRRLEIIGTPLPVLLVISSILNKYQMLKEHKPLEFKGTSYSLKEWRESRIPHLKQWIDINHSRFFTERMKFFREPLRIYSFDKCDMYLDETSNYRILNKYQDAYFQDFYEIIINYEEGQMFSFCEKEKVETESVLDLFPPMRFCKAANDMSRQYICSDDPFYRKGVTMDHSFVKWLLDNAVLLNQYYQRQFRQIIDCLCNDVGEEIINKCNNIYQQLVGLSDCHGVDVSSFPQLGMDDFFVMK